MCSAYSCTAAYFESTHLLCIRRWRLLCDMRWLEQISAGASVTKQVAR